METQTDAQAWLDLFSCTTVSLSKSILWQKVYPAFLQAIFCYCKNILKKWHIYVSIAQIGPSSSKFDQNIDSKLPKTKGKISLEIWLCTFWNPNFCQCILTTGIQNFLCKSISIKLFIVNILKICPFFILDLEFSFLNYGVNRAFMQYAFLPACMCEV